eukprot:4432010-Amphidinium_carterae.1
METAHAHSCPCKQNPTLRILLGNGGFIANFDNCQQCTEIPSQISTLKKQLQVQIFKLISTGGRTISSIIFTLVSPRMDDAALGLLCSSRSCAARTAATAQLPLKLSRDS